MEKVVAVAMVPVIQSVYLDPDPQPCMQLAPGLGAKNNGERGTNKWYRYFPFY